jgi:2-C-methyl-D-erythritol 4-phosphate cytidylyltransferase
MLSQKQIAQRVVAVILGAGQGTRVGRSINKIFIPINGKPVIAYAMETFEQCVAIDEVMLVTAAGEEAQVADLARQIRCTKVRQVVPGGANRHESERCALEALRPSIAAGDVEIVLMHDGARPFFSAQKVLQLVDTAREAGGAILAVPLEEDERVVKVQSGHFVEQSFVGRQAWKAQTPQAFHAALLLAAYDQAGRDGFYGTDTSASVERIGGHIILVESDASNLKITTLEDLFLAEHISRRWQQRQET